MDYKNELTELARNIESVIEESLESLKLNEAKNHVNSAMDRAIDEVRKALDQAGDKLDAAGERLDRKRERTTARISRRQRIRGGEPAQNDMVYENGPKQERQYLRNIPDIGRMSPAQLLRYSQIPVTKNPAGNVSGILCTIFGALGVGLFAIPTLIGLIVMAADGIYAEIVGALVFLAGMTAGSGFLLKHGISLRARVKRFYRYLRIINNRTYCDVREIISSQAGEPKLVIRDLKFMIRSGMFLEGHLDETDSTLMLTDKTYQEYLTVKTQREQEARQAIAEQAQIEEDPQLAALKEAVEEGERYIEMIRKANVEITGEAVSQKLYRLEDVTRKIFEHIKKHPQKLSDIRKFMGYYLPTTLKLVHVYCELERQSVNGDNINNAKADIERTLDTINVAFENLLDDLFEETAMDVSTDISVLEAMLAQEGLTESDLHKWKEDVSQAAEDAVLR